MSSLYQVNGGSPLTHLQDYEVAERVKQNIPPKTYTRIEVKTIQYRFPSTNGHVSTKQICLKQTKLHITREVFSVVLKTLVGIRVDNSPVDEDLVLNQIIGNDGTAAGIDEVKKAWAQCKRFELHISEDLDNDDPSQTDEIW